MLGEIRRASRRENNFVWESRQNIEIETFIKILKERGREREKREREREREERVFKKKDYPMLHDSTKGIALFFRCAH